MQSFANSYACSNISHLQCFRAIEEDDKKAFKMNLNHILSCRSWDILPDIMDMFESKNGGKDLGHFMKKLLGKKIAEAFQPLCKSFLVYMTILDNRFGLKKEKQDLV